MTGVVIVGSQWGDEGRERLSIGYQARPIL